MGRYLYCGIATKITILKDKGYSKEKYSKEEILEEFGKELDLSIFQVEENEKTVILKIKEEIFENNIVDFITEQLKELKYRDKYIKEELEKLQEIKGLNFYEIMEFANKKRNYVFQYLEGCIVTNDIRYITEKFITYADVICYVGNGKIFMEEYHNVFYYIRNLIIKSSKNPIRTAAVITIVG